VAVNLEKQGPAAQHWAGFFDQIRYHRQLYAGIAVLEIEAGQ
jgi:hypothetical protein